jgi:hypothetical protein
MSASATSTTTMTATETASNPIETSQALLNRAIEAHNAATAMVNKEQRMVLQYPYRKKNQLKILQFEEKVARKEVSKAEKELKAAEKAAAPPAEKKKRARPLLSNAEVRAAFAAAGPCFVKPGEASFKLPRVPIAPRAVNYTAEPPPLTDATYRKERNEFIKSILDRKIKFASDAKLAYYRIPIRADRSVIVDAL